MSYFNPKKEFKELFSGVVSFPNIFLALCYAGTKKQDVLHTALK